MSQKITRELQDEPNNYTWIIWSVR